MSNLKQEQTQENPEQRVDGSEKTAVQIAQKVPKPSGSLSAKRAAANRNNALRSTGPRTLRGKANSSRNSIKHGILAVNPVVAKAESVADWEAHLEGFLRDFAPASYLETHLVVQLATLSWRKIRVARCEAQATGAALARASADLEEAEDLCFSRRPLDQRELAEETRIGILVRDMLKSLSTLFDRVTIDTEGAVATLYALYAELPPGVGKVSVRGIPDDPQEFDDFEEWTAGLLRRAAMVYAEAGAISSNELYYRCERNAAEKVRTAMARERANVKKKRDWNLLLERERASRLLLPSDVAAKVNRYETTFDKSFFRTLEELRKLQAERRSLSESSEIITIDSPIQKKVLLKE